MGGAKAETAVGRVPMLDRAVAAVRAVVDDVVVVSSRPLAACGAPVIPDRVEGAGPLGGLDAALRHARSRGLDGVLLVACDLPLLTPALLRGVAGALGDHLAAAPERPGGGVEPLCAAYRVGALDAVERRLGGTERSMQGLFRELGGVPLPAAELDVGEALLNVNTPEERERAEAALSRRGER
jgi:molybdopterin-guanine dinucleotide biosynthesis protein A